MKSIRVLPVVYLACIAVLAVLPFLIPGSRVIPRSANVHDPGKAIVDSLYEMTKVVASLDSALFAGAAALAVKGREWSTRWGRVDAFLVMLSMVAGAASYYGIYLTHDSILSMVFEASIYPFERRLQAALSLQYYGLLTGVLLLGLVFTRLLEDRRRPADA